MKMRIPRNIVELSFKMDVMLLKKWGYFSDSKIPGRLSWSISGIEQKSIEALVDLEKNCINFFYNNEFASVRLLQTKCNFGGVRYWFECPCCKKRMRTLYVSKDDIVCRKCLNLAYECQNIGGILKQFGRIIPNHKLDEALDNIKRRYYRGVPTKKYKRYLIEREKTSKAIKKVLSMLC